MSKIKTFVDANPKILELTYDWNSDSKITFKKEDENGFDISIEDDGDSILLETDNGYHDCIEINNFKSEQEALLQVFGLVRDLLSNNMRIRVIMKSGKPIKWILEYFEHNKWREESTMGLLTLNIFGKTTEQVFSNNILPSRSFND
jgi:hypothetical protein